MSIYEDLNKRKILESKIDDSIKSSFLENVNDFILHINYPQDKFFDLANLIYKQQHFVSLPDKKKSIRKFIENNFDAILFFPFEIPILMFKQAGQPLFSLKIIHSKGKKFFFLNTCLIYQKKKFLKEYPKEIIKDVYNLSFCQYPFHLSDAVEVQLEHFRNSSEKNFYSGFICKEVNEALRFIGIKTENRGKASSKDAARQSLEKFLRKENKWKTYKTEKGRWRIKQTINDWIKDLENKNAEYPLNFTEISDKTVKNALEFIEEEAIYNHQISPQNLP